MANKFKLLMLLVMVILSFNVSAQTKEKSVDDSVRIAFGPKPLQSTPAFPGGMAGYFAFLRSNVRYTSTALEKKIQGVVFIQFIVEKDGSLSNIKVLKDLGEGLGEEAVRVIKLSPKWSVGMDNGHPVRVQVNVPVNFVLPKTTTPPNK